MATLFILMVFVGIPMLLFIVIIYGAFAFAKKLHQVGDIINRESKK